MKPQSLLFLCLGNICRSMLARGIAEHHIRVRNLPLRVDGAGISDFHHGEGAHPPIIALARRHGIDLSPFKSKPITQELADQFDWIVAMDSSNIRALSTLCISHPHIHKMGDFGLKGVDIPDPYTFTRTQDLERVYTMIEQGVGELLTHCHV
ncbi:low molecular weight protein-tyrosine-phosphatase [Helicobacter cynogastricus]|uniref:low molecular weight protein-tyrosine-phosphatase n=1 Tax=Helicobacter cynogastricus TaxID=329937 RepID=UPI000CF098B4|nr:low molecular weight protein-tyrosine-phosphatase [Helicobacter cynogastricus]